MHSVKASIACLFQDNEIDGISVFENHEFHLSLLLPFRIFACTSC